MIAAFSEGGTAGEDVITGATPLQDGSVLLVGYTFGDWDEGISATLDKRDFAAVQLDANGNEVWRWQVISKNI